MKHHRRKRSNRVNKTSRSKLSGSWWLRYWDSISTSFWAIPSLLTLSASALAMLLIYLEIEGLLPVSWLMQTKPEEARQILSIVAASAISVAGVTFSIVIVVLTLASSQLGPRLVRSFIHDRANQLVLGVFVATFAYCILLLGAVGSYTDSFTFAPRASLAMAIVLAMLDVAVFIYFIHHLAVGIQSPQVIQRVGEELDIALDRCFTDGEPPKNSSQPPSDDPILVLSQNNGYVHGIDIDYLLAACNELELKVECLVEVGEFVLFSAPILKLWGDDQAAHERCQEGDAQQRLSDGVLLASQRSPVQDPTFAMNQLVEIAVRSLSPGINDPFTAMNAANRMAAALVRIAGRNDPQAVFGDEQPRLWVHWREKTDYVDTMFAALTEYADGSTLVNQHLLSLCSRLLARIEEEKMRKRIGKYAELIIDQLGNSPLPVGESEAALKQRVRDQLEGPKSAVAEEQTADTGTTGD